jgi:hypothetical protein
MGCPAKRKSTAEREEFDMFPAQEKASIFRHWADPLLKLPAAMTGNSKLAKRFPLELTAVDLFSEDSELRKRVTAELLRFPESKGVFGRLSEPRFSHLSLAEQTICCLLGWLGPSQHCPPHANKASQPGRVAKLKSSFATQLG